MTNMLGVAIAITAEAFRDTLDKGGKPYILHCLRVMNAMPKDDIELRCAAVMHDLVEDTDENSPINYTNGKLVDLGFSARVCNAVYLLTHRNNMPYEDYIKTIAFNSDAVKVKLADLRDNTDITRLKGLSKKDFDRMEKYHKAFTYLSKI